MLPAVVVVEFEGERCQGTVETTWIDTTTRCRMMVIKVALDANNSDDLSELLDAAEDEHVPVAVGRPCIALAEPIDDAALALYEVV